MRTTLSRKQILERLAQQVEQKSPIVVATAGNGLMAKLIELGGADIILTYHTAQLRMKGLPSVAPVEGSFNEIVEEMAAEQVYVTDSIPLVAGINAHELPTDEQIINQIDRYVSLGFNGIANFPTIGFLDRDDVLVKQDVGERRKFDALNDAGLNQLAEIGRESIAKGMGFNHEVRCIELAHKKGIFTCAYCFTADDAEKMALAGADMIVAHCGGTSGGLTGTKGAKSYTGAAEVINWIYDGARKGNPDALLLGHGGPFSGPEYMDELYRLTPSVGFVSGSSVERIPVERAVIGVVKEFKNYQINR